MIHDHLKQNGIETMSKQPGTGEYMSIAMGYSVYGTDIYVREDQKAKAEALINELLYDNDYNTSEDEDIKLPWWQNKVIVAKCILGFFILVIIIMIASADLSNKINKFKKEQVCIRNSLKFLMHTCSLLLFIIYI